MGDRYVERIHSSVARALREGGVVAGSRVVVGVSGGADSTALLHVLLELSPRMRFTVAAAHLNHHLRGAESRRDERFVRAMCSRLGVELTVGHARGLARGRGNLEERARNARRRFLARAARRARADFIATAHHADDQAETVLMRFLRGAGATGLSAIAPVGPDKFVRPMISISRDDIVRYLRARRIAFVEDSSNRSSKFLRNRIRLELIPMLEREYAPGLRTRLAGLATEMRSLDTMLTQLAREELGRHRKRGAIEVVRLNSLPVALRAAVVRVFLSEHGIGLARISRKHVDAALKLAIGQPAAKSIDIPGGRRLIRDGSKLKIEARRLAGEPQDFEVRLKSSGRTRVPQAGFEFVARIETAKSAAMPASLSEAVFDRAVVRERGMRVRPVQSGDRIAPLGMSGTRKLSDIYIDRKVKRQRRANWPVVVLGDEICWIPGLVRGRAGLVNPSSKAIVRLAAREYGG